MIDLFAQKRELDLIRLGNGSPGDVETVANDVDFILLIAGHKPVKTKLSTIISGLSPIKNANLKFATASFMGYGLYKESMLSLEQFKKLLKIEGNPL